MYIYMHGGNHIYNPTAKNRLARRLPPGGFQAHHPELRGPLERGPPAARRQITTTMISNSIMMIIVLTNLITASS